MWKRAGHGTTVRYGHDVIAYADHFHAYASNDANILAPSTWGIASVASFVVLVVDDAVVVAVVVVGVAPTFSLPLPIHPGAPHSVNAGTHVNQRRCRSTREEPEETQRLCQEYGGNVDPFRLGDGQRKFEPLRRSAFH